MDGRSRQWISILIWLSYVLIMVIALPIVADRSGSFASVAIIASATFAVLASMGFVWNWGNVPLSSSAAEEAEKAKRRTRAERIIEGLSEEDLRVLRQRLSESDDEQVSVGTLLREDGELRRK